MNNTFGKQSSIWCVIFNGSRLAMFCSKWAILANRTTGSVRIVHWSYDHPFGSITDKRSFARTEIGEQTNGGNDSLAMWSLISLPIHSICLKANAKVNRTIWLVGRKVFIFTLFPIWWPFHYVRFQMTAIDEQQLQADWNRYQTNDYSLVTRSSVNMIEWG